MSIFSGSGVALVTPFNKNGIDFPAMERLIEFQISEGTDALIVCGTTGEPATMSHAEKMAAIRFTVEKARSRVPVIAGTGSNNTAQTIEDSLEAQSLGADGLLLVTPYYNRTTQKGLALHFAMIADAVKIPCILYNVPPRTGLNMKPSALAEVADHPRIVGMKEASGDIEQILEMARLCQGKIDFYSGTDEITLPILACGGIGVISVVANIAPCAMHNLVTTYLQGDVEASRRLQWKLLPLIKALFIENSPVPVKTALGMMGMIETHLRMPLCAMEPHNLEHLRQEMVRLGLSIKA